MSALETDDFTWTPQRTEALRTAWSDGKSGREIALMLGGVSRVAVIAKASRMGFLQEGRRKPTVSRLLRAPVVKVVPIASQASARWSGKKAVARAEALAQAPPQPIQKPVGGVTLLDLQHHHCRWPLGDPNHDTFRFCGRNKVTGRVYCGRHVAKAYWCPADGLRNPRDLERSVRRHLP